MLGVGFDHKWISVSCCLCVFKSMSPAEQEWGRALRKVYLLFLGYTPAPNGTRWCDGYLFPSRSPSLGIFQEEGFSPKMPCYLAVGKRIAQIPTHILQDNFELVMPPLERSFLIH
jgi:hypothetical protein